MLRSFSQDLQVNFSQGNPLMNPIHIIGVPLDLGAGRRGVDMGPSAMRIAGVGGVVSKLGRELTDRGDLPAPIRETCRPGDPSKKYIEDIADVCRDVFTTALASQRDEAIPVVLGGDHSLAAGSVVASAACARDEGERIGLLWVDAHGDMNTPDTSTSGNVHGMALSALLGGGPAELTGFGPADPAVEAENTVLVGVRNLDPAERDQVLESGIHVYTMKDVDQLGMARVAEKALELAGNGTAGVHVSFDLDVCDPGIAPGVGTPVKGGLSYREAHLLMETVADTGLLRALDLVELNPILDVRNATAELGVELLLSALGHGIL